MPIADKALKMCLGFVGKEGSQEVLHQEMAL